MKNFTKLGLAVILLQSFLFSNSISSVFSIRHDNLDDNIAVSNAIGLKMQLDDTRYTGFDTDGSDYRIFVGWGFGKIGFGHDGDNNAEYSIGTTYQLLNNVSIDLDYIMTNSDNTDDNLRLGVQIEF